MHREEYTNKCQFRDLSQSKHPYKYEQHPDQEMWILSNISKLSLCPHPVLFPPFSLQKITMLKTDIILSCGCLFTQCFLWGTSKLLHIVIFHFHCWKLVHWVLFQSPILPNIHSMLRDCVVYIFFIFSLQFISVFLTKLITIDSI